MLRFIRTLLGLLSLIATTLLFIDITGYARAHWGWLASIQFIPALLATNLLVVAILIIATLLFGRIYCSVICPLGIFQDVIARIRIWCSKSKKRHLGIYRFHKERRTLRLSFFGMFVVLLVLGAIGIVSISFAGLFEPYSAYGRIAGGLFGTASRPALNYAVGVAADNGTFLMDGIATPSPANIIVLAIATITLIVVTIMAWRSGREYCNTVCPVGTILGFFSSFSLFRPVIDTDKCNRCGSCGRHCKAQCIDTKNHRIDLSRCVDCMDCISSCNQGAISYSIRRPQKASGNLSTTTPNSGRRSFMIGSAIALGAVAASAASKTTDGGLAPLKKKQRHDEASPVIPAGAISHRHLESRCTACQLCITACPNGVLKPSTSLNSLMQPVMLFTKGFCRPECTACADICPVDAITPIDTATKAATKIGTAVVDTNLCISAKYGQSCGNCQRHCPTQAITMIDVKGKLRPVVNEELCIGCGACEYHCPVGTASHYRASVAAIHVEGLPVHRSI